MAYFASLEWAQEWDLTKRNQHGILHQRGQDEEGEKRGQQKPEIGVRKKGGDEMRKIRKMLDSGEGMVEWRSG